jgi:hypothetical protein
MNRPYLPTDRGLRRAGFIWVRCNPANKVWLTANARLRLRNTPQTQGREGHCRGKTVAKPRPIPVARESFPCSGDFTSPRTCRGTAIQAVDWRLPGARRPCYPGPRYQFYTATRSCTAELRPGVWFAAPPV